MIVTSVIPSSVNVDPWNRISHPRPPSSLGQPDFSGSVTAGCGSPGSPMPPPGNGTVTVPVPTSNTTLLSLVCSAAFARNHNPPPTTSSPSTSSVSVQVTTGGDAPETSQVARIRSGSSSSAMSNDSVRRENCSGNVMEKVSNGCGSVTDQSAVTLIQSPTLTSSSSPSLSSILMPVTASSITSAEAEVATTPKPSTARAKAVIAVTTRANVLKLTTRKTPEVLSRRCAVSRREEGSQRPGRTRPTRGRTSSQQ